LDPSWQVGFSRLCVIAFLNTYILQGSGAMRMRCIVIFNFAAFPKMLLSLRLQNFENRLILGKVRGENKVVPFPVTEQKLE